MLTQHVHGYKRGTLRTKHINQGFHPHSQPALQIVLILSLLIQPRAIIQPATVTASEPTSDAPASDPPGGHLGWPVSPTIDLRTAADAHVTPIGSYKTSIAIEIPGGPGAPSLSLNYDSAMGPGIAGVGWDLSTGWPSLIARDTRFGTPTWDYGSPWVWGGAPLVAENPTNCQMKGICAYRTAPDSLSIITINQVKNTAEATVILPSGVRLFYEAVHYDGKTYPVAPPGDTDVFAYLLKSVQDPNGYQTLFCNHHWGDQKTGRSAVLKEIRYGASLNGASLNDASLTDCDTAVKPKSVHRIEIDYVDPLDPNFGGYFAPFSFRMGARVSVNNLLTNIRIYAADGDQFHPESGYRFEYQDALSTETRLPLLKAVYQQVFPNGNKQERRIRQFTYGKRLDTFSPNPTVIDLGLNTDEFPSSLSGSVSRPVRLPYLINNPNGIFQTGNDQIEKDAPAASILTKQWNLMDFNGDGLLDMLVADEKGMPQRAGSEGPWPTYELNDDPGTRPAEQWVYINEGITGNRLLTSKVLLDTSTDPSTALLTNSYPLKVSDPADRLRVETNWIWQEGRGQTRIGMPQSVTSPEIYQGGCPAIEPGSDTRLWPFLPDNTRISETQSLEQNLVEKLSLGAADIDLIRKLWKDYKKAGRSPRATVSAQLSGWSDLDRDGHPDWVVTPAMIEKFDFKCPNILNPPIPRDPGGVIFPAPEPGANMPTFGNPTWYVAEGDNNALLSSQNTGRFIMRAAKGPSLPIPQPIGPPLSFSQPLSFSVDWSEGDGYGFTIPVGTSISSYGALSQGPKSPYFWMALENLIMQTHAPRSQAGMSFNLDLNTGSVTQSIANSAISTHARDGNFSFAGATKGAILSTVDFNLDITLLAGGNVGRSQNRAGLMDWNADGCPDYLLYDGAGSPAGTPATQKAGGLLLFQSNCAGDFLPPVRINDGFETKNDQDAEAVRKAAEQVGQDITINALEAAAIPMRPGESWVFNVIRAREICDDITRTEIARCRPLVDLGKAAIVQITQVADAAQPFLDSSTDALPSERRLINDARVLAGWLEFALASNVFDPVFGSARLAGSIVEAQRLSNEISNTVTLLAFQSRINVISKGESLTAQWQDCVPESEEELEEAKEGKCEPGKSIIVQTEGLADLNGDGLPDYIITRNAKKTCAEAEWEVYWGTGTSNLSKSRGFVAEKECLKVPQSPEAVKNLFPSELPNGIQGGFQTIPMQVNFTEHDGNGLPGIRTSLTTYSYVALLDYNQDGLLDLVLANQDGEWKTGPQPLNIWKIYLNRGCGIDRAGNKDCGFDVDRPPLLVSGLSVSNGTLPANVTGARDAMYPGINSGLSDAPIIGGLRRSSSSVDIGFLDVNTDGTADIAQRVTIKSGNSSPDRAGILYWSRAGSAPQDLLIEELETLTGVRTLVKYAPAPNFQWNNGEPDGKLPPGGHRAALGTTAFLVRSVTVEPFSGRATRQTSLGYDYKDPYYDHEERVFRGFGRIVVTPLDPTTGYTISTASSLVIYHSQLSNGRGGETLERVVDGQGVPVGESLNRYSEKLSIQNSSNSTSQVGIFKTYFSARSGSLSIEYPANIRQPAVLDLSFDGRWPLANRSDRSVLASDFPQNIIFDGMEATGGGMRLVAAQSQRIRFTNRQPNLNLAKFTLETWIKVTNRSGRHIILHNPEGYELAVEQSGDLTFAVKVGGTWARLSGGKGRPNTWTHIAASYDGKLMRMFVNGDLVGTLAADGPITYPADSSGLRIGTGLDLVTQKEVNYFDGVLGELRIYPEAWDSPPRITESRTKYQLNQTATDYGLPLETWLLGDLTKSDDNVYEKITYAKPVGSSLVRNAVASQERRIFQGPSDNDLGGYLGYSETAYDELPIGKVISGNITMQAVYGGPVDVSSKPTPDIITLTRYADTHCPGVATETEDPLGAITRMAYDETCTFQLTVSNTLGHTTQQAYYGVNGIDYLNSAGYRTDREVIAGRFGQLMSTIGPNGELSVSGYDAWGRPTSTFGPYDPTNRPSIKTSYQDPIMNENQLLTPARIKTLTWDDMQSGYNTSYTFGDGQTQVEAVNAGKPDWIISGTQDFDALGRVIVAYKPRFLSDAAVPGKACQTPGEWCYVEHNLYPKEADLVKDPLRDPAKVARVQTAYDQRGRVVRIYGPDVPWCGDPSAIDIFGGGGLICDSTAQNAKPAGHFTSYEYPALGVVRVIDARGVPSVAIYDALNRLRRTEEYSNGQLYSYVEYDYQQDNNVITVTDKDGNKTIASYDALGHKLTSSDPDMGDWVYTYDRRGQLETQTDARGNLTENFYDLLGRLVRTDYFKPETVSPDRNYTFEGDAGDSELVAPINTEGNVTWHKELIPGTNIHALWARGNRNGNQAIKGEASFDLDLTRASKAQLSFRYLSTAICVSSNTNCNSPTVSVEYTVAGTSTRNKIFSDGSRNRFTPAKNLEDLNSSIPITRVTLPELALGKKITVIFRFQSNLLSVQSYAWGLDDIQVQKFELEDTVSYQYDSAELASAYESSILDLTFDTPNLVIDRSSYHHPVDVKGTKPVEGISGQGLEFNSVKQDSLAVEIPTFSPHTSALTIEAWVKPSSPRSTASQYIVFRDKEYALARGTGDKLICQIFVNRDWQTAESDVSLPMDIWSHATLTYDGNELNCYVNGKTYGPDSRKIISGTLDLSGGYTTIGSRSGIDSFYNGQLDEVRVLDILRKSTEVLADALSPLRHGPPRGNVLDLTFSDFEDPGADSSGANNPAVQVPPKAQYPGIEGTAIRFDGSPGSVVVVNSSDSIKSNESNELTAEVWVKTEKGEQGDKLLIGKWGGVNTAGWRLALERNSGSIRFEVNTFHADTGTYTEADFVTRETVNDGAWYHVAATYEGSNIRVYINGKPAHRICTDNDGKEITCSIPPEPPKCPILTEYLAPENGRKGDYELNVCITGTISNDLPVLIGAYDSNTPSLNGMEDEVRISNYAKRDFEVAASARLYSAYTQVLGQPVEVRNLTARDNTGYDLLGRAVSVQRYAFAHVLPLNQQYLAPSGPFLVRSAFDNQGRVRSMRYPDGEVVVSEYDRGGNQVSLTGYGNFEGLGSAYGKFPYFTSAWFTVTSRLARLEYSNRVVTTFRYDEGPTKKTDGKPNIGTFGNELLAEQVTVLPSGEVLQDQSYTYDDVGNLLTRRDYGPPSLRTPPAQHANPLLGTYTYDDLNRLKSYETRLGSTLVGSGTYDYDPLGNLVSKETVSLQYGQQAAGAACGIGFTARPPHAVTYLPQSNTDYCYDANGALAEVRSGASIIASYLHNVRGKLIELNNASGAYSFTYDGNGTRVHKVEPRRFHGRTFLFVTTEPFPFYRVAGQVMEKYYFALGRMITRRIGPGRDAVYWYHTEHLSSTTYMTNADGNELQDAYSEYKPFGGALSTSANNTGGTQANQDTPNSDRSGGFQFTGKELDDTGLYYYGARYYDHVIGRFIEADNITLDAWPQALNRYSYVFNNPLKYVDPSGNYPCEHCSLVSEIAYHPCEQCSLGVSEPQLRMSSEELAWLLAPPGVAPSMDIPPVGYLGPKRYVGPTISEWRPDWDPNKGIPGLKTQYTALGDIGFCALTGGLGCAALSGIRIAQGYDAAKDAIIRGDYAEASLHIGSSLASLWLLKSTLHLRPGLARQGLAPVQRYRQVGNAFSNDFASRFRLIGLEAVTEVGTNTPFGYRFSDIQVRFQGQPLFRVEVKVGTSRYHNLQRIKDAWIQRQIGERTFLKRGP